MSHNPPSSVSSGEPPHIAAVRKTLAAACLDRKRRTHEWTPQIPTEWQPEDVTNPFTIGDGLTGVPFTPESAWRFVHSLLEQGVPLQEVDLEKPPNRKGYVMQVPLGGRMLYIKLMPWSNGVYGRSFHWSDR